MPHASTKTEQGNSDLRRYQFCGTKPPYPKAPSVKLALAILDNALPWLHVEKRDNSHGCVRRRSRLVLMPMVELPAAARIILGGRFASCRRARADQEEAVRRHAVSAGWI